MSSNILFLLFYYSFFFISIQCWRPKNDQIKILPDFSKNYVAYRDEGHRRCYLEYFTNMDEFIRNDNRVLYVSPEIMNNKAEIYKKVGKKIAKFCFGYPVEMLVEKLEEPKYQEDISNTRIKRNTNSQTGRKYRGQSQSQFLTYRTDSNAPGGIAEGISQHNLASARVSASNGMGQAQSQSSFDDNCEGCAGKSITQPDPLIQSPHQPGDRSSDDGVSRLYQTDRTGLLRPGGISSGFQPGYQSPTSTQNGQERPGTQPSHQTSGGRGTPPGQYIPGSVVPGRTGPQTGQYSPGSISSGPGSQTGQHIPGGIAPGRTGPQTGQYSPGSISTGPGSQTGQHHIPGGVVPGRTGPQTGQYSPGSISSGPGSQTGQYIPGGIVPGRTGPQTGQYSPGSISTGPGSQTGQYIPGGVVPGRTGQQTGQYSPGSVSTGLGSQTGQHVPGGVVPRRTGAQPGQYIPGVAATGLGSQTGQHVPGGVVPGRTGAQPGQYIPGVAATGPGSQTGQPALIGGTPGTQTGQYFPGAVPIGSDTQTGQYIPGGIAPGRPGTHTGQYIPGTVPTGSDAQTGQYIPGGIAPGRPGTHTGQYIPGSVPTENGTPTSQLTPGFVHGGHDIRPGQYSPGGLTNGRQGVQTGPGGRGTQTGQYIPGGSSSGAPGTPTGQHTPTGGPGTQTGQYSPGAVPTGIGGSGIYPGQTPGSIHPSQQLAGERTAGSQDGQDGQIRPSSVGIPQGTQDLTLTGGGSSPGTHLGPVSGTGFRINNSPLCPGGVLICVPRGQTSGAEIPYGSQYPQGQGHYLGGLTVPTGSGQHTPGAVPTGSGTQTGQQTTGGIVPGRPGTQSGQYFPGTTQTGQQTPSGVIPERPGTYTGQYFPGTGPSGYGAQTGQHTPSEVPGRSGAQPGQYLPGVTINGQGAQTGQYFPGGFASGRPGTQTGQYITGTGTPTSEHSPIGTIPGGHGVQPGQYVPGGLTGSGHGGQTGQHTPSGSVPRDGTQLGQYVPGDLINGGQKSHTGQYIPSSFVPGATGTQTGTYIPGVVSPGTGAQTGQTPGYVPGGYGPQTGQYIPGTGIGGQTTQHSPGSDTTGGTRFTPDQNYPGGGGGLQPGSQYAPQFGIGHGTQLTLGTGSQHGEQSPWYQQPSQQGGRTGSPSGQIPGTLQGGHLHGGDSVHGLQYPQGSGNLGLIPGTRYPVQPGQTYLPGTGAQATDTSYPYSFQGPSPHSTVTGLQPSTTGSLSSDDQLSGTGRSQVQTSVTQENNETLASSSAQGSFGTGKAQTQVSGSYKSGGSFSAQAQTSDGNKGAQSQIIGGKDGATSAGQAHGGTGQSQAEVKLSSDTGLTSANSQTSGKTFSSQSQVQGGATGGSADSQAKGQGMTQSQAQIGFFPYQNSRDNDGQTVPYRGGASASAQTGGFSGSSQSKLQGAFKYGISYTGTAQASSGTNEDIAKDGLSPLEPLQQLTHDIGQSQSSASRHSSSSSSISSSSHNSSSIQLSQNQNSQRPNTPSFTAVDLLPVATSPIIPSLQTGRSENRQSQSIHLGKKYNQDVKIIQDAAGPGLSTGGVIQPGQVVPGSGGYVIPNGFRGRVVGNAGEHARVITDEGGQGQTQSVILTPGNGSVSYTGPASTASPDDYDVTDEEVDTEEEYEIEPTPATRTRTYDGPYIRKNPPPRNSYVTYTNSVTGRLDSNGKLDTKNNYAHTYYTKSSACGYFTFSCNIVNGSNGRTKICRPQGKTKPDGTPCNF